MNSLCAGFGSSIGSYTFDLIRQIGFGGVRQDVPTFGDAAVLIPEFGKSKLTPTFLVGGGPAGERQQDPEEIIDVCREVARCMQTRLVFGSIEMGNELDTSQTYKDDPDKAGRLWQDAAAAILQENPNGVGIITGGISNTSKDAISWLSRAIKAAPALPSDAAVGFHSYRANPQEAKSGYSDRHFELRDLRAAAGGSRTLVCTEVGYHTASGRGCFGRKTKGLTDQQVYEYALAEIAFLNGEYGISLAWYQLNDGPNDVAADRYGVRYSDGTLKPVCDAFK